MKLRKLIPVSVLGIAALALAGCGVFDGDDDDSPAPAVSMSGMDMPDDDAQDDDAPDGDAETAAQTLEDRASCLGGASRLMPRTPSARSHKLRSMPPCNWKATKRNCWP